MSPIEFLPPGVGDEDERWHRARHHRVSASEVAAVMGISPWESPFSVYWRKAMGWRSDGNDFMDAGHRLEDAIAKWWADRHPSWQVCPAGLYAHAERQWQLASPDRLLYGLDWASPDAKLLSLLECKYVAHSWDGWGAEGTDDIPVYYRAQALWQLDVMDVDTVYFAALGPGGFRAYGPIRRDEQDLRMMRAAAREFLDRLEAGDPPPLDGHDATLAALRHLYPLGSGEVEVPQELAETYRRARALRDRAKDLVARCEARIRDALGSDYDRAVCGGRLVASRSVYERRSDDEHELHALDDGWPVTDRLNPGRVQSYA